MNDRPCIRCHQLVQLEDGHLVYCSHCGAPQIFLSEELQAEIAQTTREYAQKNAPAPAPPPDAPAAPRWARRSNRLSADPARQVWPLGVEYALLAAAVTLAMGFFSILVPPASALMLLWVLGAPVLTVTLFNTRAKTVAPSTSGFAARLGFLTAILVVLSCAITFTLSLVLKRFVFHNAALFDAQIAASFAQQRDLALQRLGATVQPTLDMLAIPEFRVGLMLSGSAVFAAFYLLLSTVAAGVTGLVVRPPPQPLARSHRCYHPHHERHRLIPRRSRQEHAEPPRKGPSPLRLRDRPHPRPPRP